MNVQVMITKPQQPDVNSASKYLLDVSKQVIQARIDINEAWQLSDEEELYKTVSSELDRVSDALVDLLKAWENISDKNFDDAIDKAAIAEELAIKSALHVWDELAASAYDDAVRALGGKIRISVANLTNAGQLKIDGEKERRSAHILYEQDDYAAIKKYREAVKLLTKSKEVAELSRFSVRGQTLQAWVKILLAFISVILVTISIIVAARGCRPTVNQIPTNRTVSAEPNDPNLSK